MIPINYAYDEVEWIYTNIPCAKLPYAEMYEKGENKIFSSSRIYRI